MERKVILISLFFCSCILFADINPDALKHYKEGVNFYNKNNFDMANYFLDLLYEMFGDKSKQLS